MQTFNGVVRPLGETRPAWKVVLRVLGSLLGLPGFAFDTAEEVRTAALGDGDLTPRLSNRTGAALARGNAATASEGAFERIADVPIYHADALVRRAGALHLTAAARAAHTAGFAAALFDRLGLKEGDAVRVRQASGRCSCRLSAMRILRRRSSAYRRLHLPVQRLAACSANWWWRRRK